MTQDIQAELRMIREMLSWLRNEERFREEILGVPAAPSGQSGQAPEPASRLGHSETVPNAALALTVQISPDIDANAAGELLLSYINDKARWGYGTSDFLRGDFVEVEGIPPLDVRTCCCGCFAETESQYSRIGWWRSESLGLDLFLHWDGDGTIVFKHAGWMLENGDCKKSYEWEWVEDGHWSLDLPAGYYNNPYEGWAA
jgi:hypothetical protein